MSTTQGFHWLSEVAFRDARTRTYVGSPSVLRLPSRRIVVSYEFFGDGAPADAWGESFITAVSVSDDDGATWQDLCLLENSYWASLFYHAGCVYLLGTSAHDGSITIRRSTDEGYTWTRPRSRNTGLLFEAGTGRAPPNYHCAPVPVVDHDGRIYRAFEDNDETKGFASGFRALVISAPVGADLLRAETWTMSNKLSYDQDSDPPDFGGGTGASGWLEGNVVPAPDGLLKIIMRCNSFPVLNKCAELSIKDDGRSIEFDPMHGFYDMPGGTSKFTVRRDSQSGLYWSLVNDMADLPVPIRRNRLSVIRSRDLRRWEKATTLMQESDPEDPVESTKTTGFQYVDWQFDGDDILYVIRTAYRGAHNFHDANRITFGRVPGFRSISPESVEKL